MSLCEYKHYLLLSPLSNYLLLSLTFSSSSLPSQSQGASSIVYCAGHPIMEGVSGLYIYRCSVAEPSPEAQSHGTATALWELSQQIVSNKMRKWGGTLQ